MLLPQIGQAGQERLARARALLIGCGALGSMIAEQLVRSGLGYLRVIDRDLVELTNLQRQVLFDESDAAQNLPKAAAAATRLRQINSSVRIEPIVADVDATNIESWTDVDLILDGTDNVGTRYLLNDVAVKHRVPWIYGACVGTEGRMMVIRPGGACLRCVFPEAPDPTELPTCDSAGVLGPVAAAIASVQSVAAIKWLTGNDSSVADELLTLDLWTTRLRVISLHDARRADCRTCGKRHFDFLENTTATAVRLCGRGAVQIRSGSKMISTPQQIAARLRPFGVVQQTPYFIRCDLREERPLQLTVFPDGRTLVHGTSDPARARAIHARYVGS
jgi:molybdopterin-synthase adenylyltransferase